MVKDVEKMFAASFEARHYCPVEAASLQFPDLRILHWCVSNRDIFQISGSKAQREGFEEWSDQTFGTRYRSRMNESSLIITEGCRCAIEGFPTISSIIARAGVWDIPPIVYRNGWESWRVLAWNEESIRALFAGIREIGEVRIKSLRPIENGRMEQMMLMPASDIFSGLTERQLAALTLGLEHGYYSLPSETNVDRLAQGAGLAPSTFSEHLRKAETRIFRNLRPYLQAFAGRFPGEAVLAEVRPTAKALS